MSFVGSTAIARYIHQRASVTGKRVQALGGAKASFGTSSAEEIAVGPLLAPNPFNFLFNGPIVPGDEIRVWDSTAEIGIRVPAGASVEPERDQAWRERAYGEWDEFVRAAFAHAGVVREPSEVTTIQPVIRDGQGYLAAGPHDLARAAV